ncbi:hypothetical protein UPYG_G00196430 [Umbra pygmaea]|uniref:Protein phosphatase 1 regulatory subunit 37 n=1 Tax=Umbra pygmaea TaxID=75934 RepID=A0ABD0WI58_UMBPY
MNIEEQVIDLSNVKTKNNIDDNVTSNSDEITPRISELMDRDLGKQGIGTEATDTSALGRLTDKPRGEEDNHRSFETLEIDEVNGNKNNSAPDSRAIVDIDLDISNDEQLEGESIRDTPQSVPVVAFGEGDDGGDMDIGVDLSLDDSGMLELEPDQKLCLTVEAPLVGVNADSSTSVVTDEQPEKASQNYNSTPILAQEESVTPVLDEGDNKHKHGKRVTFPSDADIVSGAVEPKDPWRHAQNVTVDEILTAYRQACVKLNCKPIPKVLKQMQELKDLTQRNECLDLKGEKLDYKACESLEEIFKRVQFKVVDLEQTSLDEDGASALFDMIEYYESATHLNISFNKHIGTRGWQAAAHMMRKTSSLQYLDARNTPLLDHSAPFVARALRISGSLAVLHLENAGLSGRPLMLLATALKMNMNLRELYLADNKLNGLQDSAQLGNLLKFNYNIHILDLRNNHIMDSGLAYVCEGLKEQRKGLVTLVLWNNQLSHNGMSYLAAALPCTQSLETLNLGHNSVGNEGIHKLKDGLISNRSVLRLGLASTKLSCEGAVAVAEFIAESPRLLRLDLRENEVKTGGLMALSLALKVNTSLLRLDLDREPKKETVKSFIETQRALLAEIQNGCKRNFILAKEKEETEQRMQQSTSMAEIATEDEAVEEEEEGAACGEHADTERKDSAQEGGAEDQTNSQSASSEGGSLPSTLESDSDTDEEEVVPSIAPPTSTPRQAGPSARAATSQHPLNASHIPPSPSAPPSPGAVMSGITVSESSGPPGTPPLPGRCISVSSPGRGHKIFMVTRVESPPDQQQLLGNMGLPQFLGPRVPVVSLAKDNAQAWKEELRIAQATPTIVTKGELQSSGEPKTIDKPLLEQTLRQSPENPSENQLPTPVITPPTEELVQTVLETPPSIVTPPTEELVQTVLEKPPSIVTPPTEELVQTVLETPPSIVTPPTEELVQTVLEKPPSIVTPPTEELVQTVLETPPSIVTPPTEELVQTVLETPSSIVTPHTEELAYTEQSLLKQAQAAYPPHTGGQGTAPPQQMKVMTSDYPLQQSVVQQPIEAVLEEVGLFGFELELCPGSEPGGPAECQTPTEEGGTKSVLLPASDAVQHPQATQTSTKPQGVLLQTAYIQTHPDSEILSPQQASTESKQQVAPESPSAPEVPDSVAEGKDTQQDPDDQTTPRLALGQEPEQELYLSEEEQAAQQHPVLEDSLQQVGGSHTACPHDPSPVSDKSDILLKGEGQNSLDDSSTDETDSVENDSGDDVEVVGSTLPNGLKPEFALHLLDPQSPKPGSCVMEHVNVTAELCCEQDLEELLLEASLETGRDAP